MESVKVDLESKTVTLALKPKGKFSDNEIKKLITASGFHVVSIEDKKMKEARGLWKMKSKNLIFSYFSLFASFGTLFCCALPSLLVVLGFGASLAGLIGIFPQIVWLSENKLIVFGFSGLLILLGFVSNFLNRKAPCPVDPIQAKFCKVARKWSIGILVLAGFLWLLGAFFAFVLVYL